MGAGCSRKKKPDAEDASAPSPAGQGEAGAVPGDAGQSPPSEKVDVYANITGDDSGPLNSNGEREGVGMLSMASGDTYTGNFVSGTFEGKGKYHCASGAVYEGCFQAGLQHATPLATVPATSATLRRS